MTKKQTVLIGLTQLILLMASFVLFASPRISAETPIPAGCPGSSSPQQPPPAECAQIPLGCPGSSQQGPVASQPTNCPYSAANSSTGGSDETVRSTGKLDGDCKDINDCKIIGYLRDFINLLSVVVGIVVAIMIVVGGIQYSASRDNPQATAAAKQRVTNAVIALIVYVFVFAILEYLVPGGVF